VAQPLRRSQGPQMPTSLPARTLPSSGFWLCLFTFALSVAIYAVLLGWQLGLGITLLLLVHELGHYVVIRAKGLPAALPVFIPFIGAYVALRRWPASARDDAEIALAGPLAGGLGAIACLVIFRLTSDLLFLPLAYLGYVLNLLNLLPIPPLDGGRIAGAISPLLWPLGLAGALGVAVATQNYLLLLVAAFLAVPALSGAGRQRQWGHRPAGVGTRLYIIVVYLTLAGVLAVGMLATHATLEFRIGLR
jgi:Zn-dependent protease